MKRFKSEEIEMIKESFELRKEHSKDFTDHIEELITIIKKLRYPIKNLNSMQRAIITGCIKKLVIDPNEKILNKSDYEILLSRKKIEKDCFRIDIAFNILNKIKKRTESKRRLFKDTFEKIDKICDSKKVCYSISNSGEIYKVGIVTEKNKGLMTALTLTSTLSSFEIRFLSEESFMKSTKPSKLVDYIKRYGKENKLSENHNRIINIMEKSSG
jgi:hypothetical protein